jgi:hypothetical protein
MSHLHPLLRLEELEPREVMSLSAFPDTSNGIYVLSDQLNQGLSNRLVQFLASHYVGTQKMLPSENARYVAANPQWVLLDYRLATASGPAAYIHGGQWASDWQQVSAHEEWFLHNTDDQRLHSGAWGWDLHDISNSDWRDYWVSSVLADMRTDGAQGVFADSFDAGIGGFWFDQYDVRFAGANAGNPSVWPNGVTWLDQLESLIGYVEDQFAATNEQFAYVPNLDALVTGWANLDYSRLDGGFLEGFGEWGPSYLHGSASDWNLSMNRALAMSAAGKVLIMQPTLLDQPDSAIGQLQRGFDLGTYLLLKGEHTYLNLVAPVGSSTGAYYYPEYGIDLGPAVTPLPADVSRYLWQGAYRRDFQNGLVLVNPTDSTLTIDLGRSYRRVTGSGGGALEASSLDDAGNYVGGSLSETSVRTVTLPPGSSAILLNEAGPGAQPLAVHLSSAGPGNNFATTFVAGGGAVALTDPAASITSNPPSQDLTALLVTLTNRPDSAAESLAADVGASGLTASYDADTGVLTIAGSASLSTYQDVLRTITYNDTADAPDPTDRVIQFVLTGSLDSSFVSTAVVTMA